MFSHRLTQRYWWGRVFTNCESKQVRLRSLRSLNSKCQVQKERTITKGAFTDESPKVRLFNTKRHKRTEGLKFVSSNGSTLPRFSTTNKLTKSKNERFCLVTEGSRDIRPGVWPSSKDILKLLVEQSYTFSRGA